MKRLVVVLAIGCISLVSSCDYISDQGFVPKSIIENTGALTSAIVAYA